jgi:hypothetical protein
MKQDMTDWMKDYAAKQDKEKQTIDEATKTILAAIKGVDRVGCLPSILANLFEAIEYEGADMDMSNFITAPIIKWLNGVMKLMQVENWVN